MSTLYTVVHHEDAEWMLANGGDEYCNATWHAVKHQSYDLDHAKAIVNNGPKQYVLLATRIENGKRYWDHQIQTKIPA